MTGWLRMWRCRIERGIQSYTRSHVPDQPTQSSSFCYLHTQYFKLVKVQQQNSEVYDQTAQKHMFFLVFDGPTCQSIPYPACRFVLMVKQITFTTPATLAVRIVMSVACGKYPAGLSFTDFSFCVILGSQRSFFRSEIVTHKSRLLICKR